MTLPVSESRFLAEARVSNPTPGTTLLTRQSDANEIVAVEIVLPMGAREEKPEQAGVGTLALRMLTRGTRSKSDYDIAVGFETLGASFSTEVQKDRAVLSIQTTVHRYDETLRLVEEILSEPTFPEDFFEIEKEILAKEILEDLDSPYYAATRLFQTTLFGNHPYAQANSGTLESVGGLTREAALEYFEARFRGRPASIGAVGNLSHERIESSLRGILGLFGEAPTLPPPPAEGAAGPQSREGREKRSIDSECLFFGFPVPGLHDPEYAALKVIDSILGGSMDSRLFSEVREKQGLVYQIGSMYPGLEWGSFFAVSLITTVQNHGKVIETLNREIERIRMTPPDDEELERAKTYLKGTYLMSQEKNSDQALLLARYHSLGLGIDFIDRYPRMIEAVSAESVVEIGRERFRDPFMAIVGPELDPD